MNTGTPHLYSPLIPALRPALAGLLAGAVCVTLSALCMLAALWCMVRLVSAVSLDWVLAAVALWLAGALLAACASWLAHAAEGQFSARLRRQVTGHLLRLPVSTLARQGDMTLRRLVADDISALHHTRRSRHCHRRDPPRCRHLAAHPPHQPARSLPMIRHDLC